jgi:hypothetical protein
MLADQSNGLTYQDMVAILADDGYQVSKSAICRYARRYMAHIQRLTKVQEETRILLKYLDDNPGTDLGRQIGTLIENGLMWRILDGREDIENMSIEDAIHYAIAARRASVYEYRYKDQSLTREAQQAQENDAARLEWLRQSLRDNPKMLAALEKELEGDANGQA